MNREDVEREVWGGTQVTKKDGKWIAVNPDEQKALDENNAFWKKVDKKNKTKKEKK